MGAHILNIRAQILNIHAKSDKSGIYRTKIRKKPCAEGVCQKQRMVEVMMTAHSQGVG